MYPAVKEGPHRYLVGRIERHRIRSTAPSRFDRQRQATEHVVAGILESPGGVCEGNRLRANVYPLRVQDGVGDRKSHVRESGVQDHRTVLEDGAPMYDRLPMHGDPDTVEINTEEVMSFDHLQPLVHHRGGIYGDLGTHPPGWMLERALRSHLEKVRLSIPEERAARSGYQNLTHLSTILPL